jgi:Helix-turn-helix domain
MKTTMPSDELNFGSGNLYSPFPIPAYQVLGEAKEFNAQRVLLALISHMNKNNRCVWPTYTRIMKVSGVRNKSTVSKALTTLVEYGFIKVFHYRDGKKERSKYYLQGSCWNPNFMNSQARQFRRASARCLACLVYLERGDYAFSGDSRIHYGCGGFVMLVLERDMPRKQIPWRDRIGGSEGDMAVE